MQIDVPSYLENSKILDAFAWKATKFLLDHGVSVQLALLLCLVMANRSVYHAKFMPVQITEYLYQAGFKDVSEYDDYGYTPSMRCIEWIGGSYTTKNFRFEFTLDSIALLWWYMSKGVGFLKSYGFYNETLLHRIARRLRSFVEIQDCSPIIDMPQYLALKSLVVMKKHDDCICACSNGGCLPVTRMMALRRESRFPQDAEDHRREGIDYRLKKTYQISEFLDSEATDYSWVAESFFRAFTFSMLELTHTCFCEKHPSDHSTASEIAEIREEEAGLIEQLDELVAESLEMFRAFEGSLTAFLKTKWKPRIDDYLEQNDEKMDAESLQKIREIGVNME